MIQRRADGLLVALTGGIASGKTAVSNRLQNLGAGVIDTDVVAREVVEPGEAGLDGLVELFGESILDSNGRLDRKTLGERVFADPAERKKLEALLHPLIETRVRERIFRIQNAPYVVLVVPLLVESGLFDDVDRVIVVDLPEKEQIRRLLARDNIKPERAEQILAAQASRQQRLERADHVIDNSGSPADLDAQVRRLHQTLLGA